MANIDAQLIVACQNGDQKALEALFARHLRALYRVAYTMVNNREDAEDITQEACLKIWRALPRFHLEEPFRPWALRIARNTAIDILRKRARTNCVAFFGDVDAHETTLANIPDTSPSQADMVDGASAQAKLDACLATVTPALRTLYTLHAREGHTFATIAEELHCSVHTVKSRYRRLLIKLRSIVGR